MMLATREHRVRSVPTSKTSKRTHCQNESTLRLIRDVPTSSCAANHASMKDGVPSFGSLSGSPRIRSNEPKVRSSRHSNRANEPNARSIPCRNRANEPNNCSMSCANRPNELKDAQSLRIAGILETVRRRWGCGSQNEQTNPFYGPRSAPVGERHAHILVRMDDIRRRPMPTGTWAGHPEFEQTNPMLI